MAGGLLNVVSNAELEQQEAEQNALARETEEKRLSDISIIRYLHR
jgi:hypothetical protein